MLVEAITCPPSLESWKWSWNETDWRKALADHPGTSTNSLPDGTMKSDPVNFNFTAEALTGAMSMGATAC